MARSGDGHRDEGKASSLVFLLITFAVLATLVHLDGETPDMRRVNQAAGRYADAWRTGDLASLRYAGSSGAEVMDNDPHRAVPARVARRVAFIVSGLGPVLRRPDQEERTGTDTTDPSPVRPDKIEVVRSAVRVTGAEATARLQVTWRLRRPGAPGDESFPWTYAVTLQQHLVGGHWVVRWTPQAVHPSLGPGQVMGVDLSQPTRSTVIGAGDTVLHPLPAGQVPVAESLLRTITVQAAPGQPDLAGPRTATIPGLEDLYDRRLAAFATLQVRRYTADRVNDPAEGTRPRTHASAEVLFTGPPRIPAQLRLTLDRRTQEKAMAAVSGVPGPATLVVVAPAKGDILASAHSGDDKASPSAGTWGTTSDPGLTVQQHPGPVFGLAVSLALLRAGYTPSLRVDCSNRYVLGARAFENTQGPGLKDVTLAAAVNGGCVTGLARVSSRVVPEALRSAALDLGLVTPAEDGEQTPGWLRSAELTGTPAFFGQAPAPTAAGRHVDNVVGEGDVLVSPLSMARAAATVATGTRRSPRLVTDPAPRRTDLPKPLSPAETRTLQDIMAKGVTESGGSAHSLASLGDVHALAGTVVTAVPAPGAALAAASAGSKRQGWCVGYVEGYAFAVLVADRAGSPGAARERALSVAARFVASVHPVGP